MKEKRYDALFILERNAWNWLCYEKDKLSTTDDLHQFKADFLGRCYSSTIVALVSSFADHLEIGGHYGVMWLEAIYENGDGCLTYNDMEDAQAAIIFAEDNLLRIGMPFTPDYKFHGRNAANKKRRNEKLRRLYRLEEMERKDLGEE